MNLVGLAICQIQEVRWTSLKKCLKFSPAYIAAVKSRSADFSDDAELDPAIHVDAPCCTRSRL